MPKNKEKFSLYDVIISDEITFLSAQ